MSNEIDFFGLKFGGSKGNQHINARKVTKYEYTWNAVAEALGHEPSQVKVYSELSRRVFIIEEKEEM